MRVRGRFHTTRKDYILNDFARFVPGKDWVDPFAGNGDLLEWALKNGAKSVSGYDIASTKYESRDTLLHPLDYSGSWVIANPPYLASHKTNDKTLYDLHGFDDLYKVALKTVCDSCEGGIFIVPLNFLSSQRSSHIRRAFFPKFRIVHCKAFEERVFEDTEYVVCVFYFEKGTSNVIPVDFSPSGKEYEFPVSERHGWILGEEFYEWLEGFGIEGVGRWSTYNLKEDELSRNIILIDAIDTGSAVGKLSLKDIRTVATTPILMLPKARNQVHVRFDSPPPIEDQLRIIELANRKLNEFRERLNSTFLTSFRNSRGYSRKRICLEVAYRMINKVRSMI